ncbi:hypothetical protein EY403_08250 [Shigella sonnei]|nr:hypothetical protein [Shigella sonnei]KAB7715529.1 hypothetical protein GBN32_00710 [Plesiomonas shigelloides]EFX1719051.1 hypothetical protein [Shigella sonnei]EFX2368273.1 hypothetical protein [Shigella sonnei]EFX2591154.1 hypothetical protein [Shigella sonnei]
MEKQTINALRSRARVAIQSQGGMVTNWSQRFPLLFAVPPSGGIAWPVSQLVETVNGKRRVIKTSHINGCTVIWQ